MTDPTNKDFVGKYIELITLDVSVPSGKNKVLHISNNQLDIMYDSNTYKFLPCEISGVTSGPNNQSASLSVSNVDMQMSNLFVSFGAFAGGYVSRVRTFFENKDTFAYPYERWKIMCMTSISRHELILELGGDISDGNSVVPSRIMNEDEFPQMGRV